MGSRSVKYLSKFNLGSNRGVSIISALISVAIVGVLVLILATMYENMGKVMRRSSMQREVDNLQKKVQDLMAQRLFCGNALRTSGGGLINWPKPYTQRTIDMVVMNDSISAPYAVASSVAGANKITDGLFIDKISLQTRDLNGDGFPDPATEVKVKFQGQDFVNVPAELRIEFRGPVDGANKPIPGTEWMGGAFKPRIIPFVAVVDIANNIVRCDDSIAGSRQSECYSGNTLVDQQRANFDSGHAACPPATCPAELPKDLGSVVFLRGFTSTGQPLCDCQRICGRWPFIWKQDPTAQPLGPWPACTQPVHDQCPTENERCISGPAPKGLFHTNVCLLP